MLVSRYQQHADCIPDTLSIDWQCEYGNIDLLIKPTRFTPRSDKAPSHVVYVFTAYGKWKRIGSGWLRFHKRGERFGRPFMSISIYKLKAGAIELIVLFDGDQARVECRKRQAK